MIFLCPWFSAGRCVSHTRVLTGASQVSAVHEALASAIQALPDAKPLKAKLQVRPRQLLPHCTPRAVPLQGGSRKGNSPSIICSCYGDGVFPDPPSGKPGKKKTGIIVRLRLPCAPDLCAVSKSQNIRTCPLPLLCCLSLHITLIPRSPNIFLLFPLQSDLKGYGDILAKHLGITEPEATGSCKGPASKQPAPAGQCGLVLDRIYLNRLENAASLDSAELEAMLIVRLACSLPPHSLNVPCRNPTWRLIIPLVRQALFPLVNG